MPCSTYPLPDGLAIVCSRSRRSSGTCQTPGCGRASVALCDFPLAGKRAGGTCSRRMCAACRHTQPSPPGAKDTIDYCPTHHEHARKLALEAKEEETSVPKIEYPKDALDQLRKLPAWRAHEATKARIALLRVDQQTEIATEMDKLCRYAEEAMMAAYVEGARFGKGAR